MAVVQVRRALVGTIDIKALPSNEPFRPFHLAARLDRFNDSEGELSETETLLYQLHQTRPETAIANEVEAQTFLRTIKPDEAGAIQKRAQDMFGMAKLFKTGKEIEVEGWKRQISSERYLAAYSEQPTMSLAALEEKVDLPEKQSLAVEIARRPQIKTGREISKKVYESEMQAEDTVLLMSYGLYFGAMTAIGVVVIGPSLIGISVGVLACSVIGGTGLWLGGRPFLREVGGVVSDAYGGVKGFVSNLWS